MSTSARRRKNVPSSSKGRGIFNALSDIHSNSKEGSSAEGKQKYPRYLMCVSCVVGLGVMVYCSYIHAWYMYTLHENNMWFTNIKEVEREISFRTENGLYYSYYKQLVQAPSLSQGVQELMNDRLTEYPDTINILERMNVYQEVILAAFYKLLQACGMQELPIMFYIKAVFALHGMLVAALFLLTWIISNSWLAAALGCAFYIFNRIDTTRVEYTIPLRECFALPFLWVQALALTVYFRPSTHGWRQSLSLGMLGVSTFLFCLFWQFNQFIMLLQAFALFGVWILDVLPARKVQVVYAIQAGSLLAVCGLQLVNRMILGSLVLSFIPATLIIMSLRGVPRMGGHWLMHGGKVVIYSVAALVLMLAINTVIKVMLQVEADEHIFKFLQNKFSAEETRDFDSRLYLCLSIFGFLTWDVYERLTSGVVLPVYVLAHLVIMLVILLDIIKLWRTYSDACESQAKGDKGTPANSHKNTPPQSPQPQPATESQPASHWLLIKTRPELVFHAVQCTFFGMLAITTLRMKYLWTPYMCVLGAAFLADSQVWTHLLSLLRCRNTTLVMGFRHAVVVVVLAAIISTKLPTVRSELNELREFWDPDTVQLMEWIQQNTEPMSSFSGSMQLMAGVKLCTGRPINNHPHYEDKLLRQKTKQLYQMYGRRTPEDVHAILKDLSSHYIILEDSICRAPTKNNCRTPDLIDLDNGMLPDDSPPQKGLVQSQVPRFCDEVRYQRAPYSKYFREVFINNTFRVYKVL